VDLWRFCLRGNKKERKERSICIWHNPYPIIKSEFTIRYIRTVTLTTPSQSPLHEPRTFRFSTAQTLQQYKQKSIKSSSKLDTRRRNRCRRNIKLDMIFHPQNFFRGHHPYNLLHLFPNQPHKLSKITNYTLEMPWKSLVSNSYCIYVQKLNAHIIST